MYSKINTIALFGLEGLLIRVECDTSNGLPEMSMVGFLGSEVREARDRVRTAMKNTGYSLPPKRITVNLAPADIRKEGTSFDLAIAAALLTSADLLRLGPLQEETVFLGELGLDGKLIPVSGILTMVGAAKAAGFRTCVLPADNAAEGALVEGIRVIGLESLDQLEMLSEGVLAAAPCRIRELLQEESERDTVDFSEVNGQRAMRRAAEIAAAGRHNLLFIGSPGSGKTMIARRIPTILPTLSLEEALEVSRIYSISGMLSRERPLILRRPFRSPHHTISPFALVGGGRVPRPGEISLANHGVLFLDELPEFQKSALEALRQPLEDRVVSISRVQGSFRFPADVMLVAAMNPCRCGYYPDRNRCRCTEAEVDAYLKRISRPLLDRMDLCVEAPPVGYSELTGREKNEDSASIRARVEAARERQILRFAGTGILFNARMSGRDVKKYCRITAEEERFLKAVFEQKGLSARSYHRILKVARTIADLKGSENISLEDLAEAVGYRGPEEKFWR
ncbi:MAG: YifB family Mg chelatase-like AAA ATPase [Lachnospiraceae bacterium]|nr:YifB family Mg chelatase-like AAA ATPase [Lachnospiraceae bacterium]